MSPSWTAADPKPEPRVRDKSVWRRFHAVRHNCLCCGESYRIQAHHVLPRARRGDDLLENLVPLCWLCHGALHGQNDPTVRDALAKFLRSEEGAPQAAYLVSKLGPWGAEAYVLKLEAAR